MEKEEIGKNGLPPDAEKPADEEVKPEDFEQPEAESEKPEGEPETKRKQSREENAKYAEERRKRKERGERKAKEREEEIRKQAVFEERKSHVEASELEELSIPSVETEDELYLVESLRKAKAEGEENPIACAYKALYRKKSEQESAKRAEAEQAEKEEREILNKVAKDQAEFKAKYGKTTSQVMSEEPEFVELFTPYIDNGASFTACYGTYLAMLRKKTNGNQAKKDGSFQMNSQTETKSASQMSDEEFIEYFNKKYN